MPSKKFSKPPYQISTEILQLVSKIQLLLGTLSGHVFNAPPVKLRKENQIKTIHHSLAIEGNSLTTEQITAIIENKKVIGPKKQILEVKNALEIYNEIQNIDPLKEKHFLSTHQKLMNNLVPSNGKYRKVSVGVFQGTQISHLAPPAKLVPELMKNLFTYLQNSDDLWLIKACVFHYELEFIHPFEDGNGRMGRLWQQLILSKQSEVFLDIPVETEVHKHQNHYYKVLQRCDKLGDSTEFIEFCLQTILSTLQNSIENSRLKPLSSLDRIKKAKELLADVEFSRKDYLNIFNDISTATASRDLEQAVKNKLLNKKGNKNLTVYKFNKK